jgi:hypothetical protein
MSYFIYISDSKLDILSQEHGKRIRDIFETAGVTLRAPFVEGRIAVTRAQPHRIALLRRVEKRITKEMKPPNFSVLREGMELPPFVSFALPLARLITSEAFWCAGLTDETGLLLAGSSNNAVGTAISPPKIGVSIDPIGAIATAARREAVGPKFDAHLSESSSFVWQDVYRHNDQDSISLPLMRGLAVTTTVVKSSRAQTRRTKLGPVARLVICTPLFIEQI